MAAANPAACLISCHSQHRLARAAGQGCATGNASSRAPATLQSVELERLLPYSIKAGGDEVDIAERYPTVHDSGVEGVTFKFKWEWYGGHHCVSAAGNAVACVC